MLLYQKKDMKMDRDAVLLDKEEVLRVAGYSQSSIRQWIQSQPSLAGDFHNDVAVFSRFWQLSDDLVSRLPRKPQRSASQVGAAEVVKTAARESRSRFLSAHAEQVYKALTQDYHRLVRAEELVYVAAEGFPGLVPSREVVSAERACAQKDKDGAEIDQGILLSHVLAHPLAGRHLCHAMLLPRPESLERLPRYLERGQIDLDQARVERRGPASHVFLHNPRYLNAEDDTTVDAVETAVDIALLDPDTSVVVLRGDVLDHPRYRGRRAFCTGVNLTHLYYGKISYLWYIKRDLGFINKMYRGVADPQRCPEEPGGTTEKPWIAAVDSFAIGGGCQYLLVMDYILAAVDSYFTLPARKEGIIPGVANLRMPRFTGDRIARRAILFDQKLMADSPEGRRIADEIVPLSDMDAAVERITQAVTNSGVVSAAANRRALRVGQEPLDLFRGYMALYALEQAYCHFSPALIRNLEENWAAHERSFDC